MVVVRAAVDLFDKLEFDGTLMPGEERVARIHLVNREIGLVHAKQGRPLRLADLAKRTLASRPPSAGVRGYNVLLQGQFRHSDVKFSSNQLERVVGEAYMGLVWGITRTTSLSYVARFQSGEIKRGPGARDTYVGSLYLNIGF